MISITKNFKLTGTQKANYIALVIHDNGDMNVTRNVYISYYNSGVWSKMTSVGNKCFVYENNSQYYKEFTYKVEISGTQTVELRGVSVKWR